MPIGAEVVVLESGKGVGSEVFRKVLEKGHFVNGVTRQGVYLITPAGELLASGNFQDPTATAAMMETALQKYKAMQKSSRLPKTPLVKKSEGSERISPMYPMGGLVLDVSLRKLFKNPPRTQQEKYRNVEWNQDHAWFRKQEILRWIPKVHRAGEQIPLPTEHVQRIARFHTIDTIRALAAPYPAEAVKNASLMARIKSVDKEILHLELDGELYLHQTNLPIVARSKDLAFPVPQKSERSYKAKMIGRATFDTTQQKFTNFELVALGEKTGGIRITLEDPTTMGVAFTIAGNTVIDKVEPRYLSEYDW